MAKENTENKNVQETDAVHYILTTEDRAEIEFIYTEVDNMIDARNNTYRQFNDRTLVQFIDDSEKRVQGYVPTRESQDKESWQSNVFNQSTRNKLKALVAGVANTPPELHYNAVSLKDGGMDLRRAEVIENLVKQSRNNGNAEADIFWEAWTCACQGTVIKYDGYLKTKYKRKFIKSYDLVTGEMEFDEKEVEVNDECIDVQVPLSELFVYDFHTTNIQDQTALAWIRYLDKTSIEKEFGQYKNFKYILDKSTAGAYKSDTETFFYQKWQDRVEEGEYEVIKYYNTYRDTYDILINGVLLLQAPMLWGRKDKVYPFSKTIFEPFTNKDFFYGNSLPNANMDTQDVINTLYNMSLDKTYRSLNPPLLAGIKNKDLLEMENERIGMESTIYVEDVNQVKYQTIPGINDSEMAMVKWVGQGMDLGTVDVNQQGVAGRGVTAREIVIANENAKKIKGLFFMFLTDLWIQKTRLRILNILMNYTKPKIKEIVGEEGQKTYEESFRTILVEGSTFPDGSKGTLAIQFVGQNEDLPARAELDIEEEKMRIQGKKFEKIALTSNYLDEFEYDVQIESDTLYQKDNAEAQAVIQEKIKTMMGAFPQIFMTNQDIMFEDFIDAYGDDPARYDLTPPPPAPIVPGKEVPTKKPNPGEGELSPLPALA
jgi:hypothetical protein